MQWQKTSKIDLVFLLKMSPLWNLTKRNWIYSFIMTQSNKLSEVDWVLMKTLLVKFIHSTKPIHNRKSKYMFDIYQMIISYLFFRVAWIADLFSFLFFLFFGGGELKGFFLDLGCFLLCLHHIVGFFLYDILQ